MRCNIRLHREFAHSVDGVGYSTRLCEGTVENHDDWSCIEDLAAAGMIEVEFRQRTTNFYGGSEARVQLTPLGQQIALQLRAHKQNGGDWADFVPELTKESENL